MTIPAVGIVPYGTALNANSGSMPLSALDWPLGQPDRLVGQDLGALAPDDHVILYPFTKMHLTRGFGTAAKVSVMVPEPAAVHRRHLRLFRFSARRFHRVLAYHDGYLQRYRNGLFLPFGSTWVPSWQTIDTTKRSALSLIASDKRKLEGHALRHQIVSHLRAESLDADIMGRGYTPFETKSDGLAPYRFSVVIENVREQNYFTEKLIDAILCETVPIYWGCPNIADFLDTSGMVICQNEDEIRAAVRDCSEERYAALSPALRAIKPKAVALGDYQRRAAETLLADAPV